eukprot:SAG31_NODE_1322_length_8786_cov_2.268576_7_plen_337_part_00
MAEANQWDTLLTASTESTQCNEKRAFEDAQQAKPAWAPKPQCEPNPQPEPTTTAAEESQAEEQYEEQAPSSSIVLQSQVQIQLGGKGTFTTCVAELHLHELRLIGIGETNFAWRTVSTTRLSACSTKNKRRGHDHTFRIDCPRNDTVHNYAQRYCAEYGRSPAKKYVIAMPSRAELELWVQALGMTTNYRQIESLKDECSSHLVRGKSQVQKQQLLLAFATFEAGLKTTQRPWNDLLKQCQAFETTKGLPTNAEKQFLNALEKVGAVLVALQAELDTVKALPAYLSQAQTKAERQAGKAQRHKEHTETAEANRFRTIGSYKRPSSHTSGGWSIITS